MSPRFVSLLFLGWLGVISAAEDVPRWTTVDGHKLRAGFGGVNGERVALILDGKPIPVPMSRLSPASQEQVRQLTPSQASTPPLGRWEYHDEKSGRQVSVRETAPGMITVVIFGSSGGYVFRWEGSGSRSAVAPSDNGKKSKIGALLSFSQVVGEGGERGTLFTGNESANGSKLEIRFAEGERDPYDPGINGTYEQISTDKALALAKKQVKTASVALEQTLSTVPRNWPGTNRRAAGVWEDRWPGLRSDWVQLVFPAAGFVAPADGKWLEPHLDYWIAQLEATGLGWGLIAYSTFEQPAVEGWDGEYDDGYGGHVSLRGGAGGAVTFNLTCSRGRVDAPQSADLPGRIPSEAQGKEGGGVLTAVYTHDGTGLPEGAPSPMIRFRKYSHFLVVETEHAQPYTGTAWFGGVYRWYPVPAE